MDYFVQTGRLGQGDERLHCGCEAGLPVICVETRHMRAALNARINNTDRNDARGGGAFGRCTTAVGGPTGAA
jgi:hypothetical protein